MPYPTVDRALRRSLAQTRRKVEYISLPAARATLLGLVSAACLGMVAPATAGATTPGWYECAKAEVGLAGPTGHYENRICSAYVATGGKYELKAGLGRGKAFKGASGKADLTVVLPGGGELQIECASSKAFGQLALPNIEHNVRVDFFKCTAQGSSCSSGARAGTIETAELSGAIGWLDSASNTVGVDLSNEAAPGSGYLAMFECQNIGMIRIHGGIIAQQTGDIDNDTQGFLLSFTTSDYLGETGPGYTPVVNQLSLEGGSESVLLTELNSSGTGGAWQPAGGLPSGLQAAFTNEGELLMVSPGNGGGGSPGGGVVAGVITNALGPVSEAFVSVCGSPGCFSIETEEDGSYELGGIPEGSYVASISPPQQAEDGELTSAAFPVTTGEQTTEDFTLAPPNPPPHGTEVSGNGVVYLNHNEYPRIYWESQTPIATEACAGGTVTLTVSAANVETGMVESTASVELEESPVGSGHFSGLIPVVYPLDGEGTVAITSSDCPDASEDKSVEFAIYIDPSGTIVDGNDGDAPIAGATVTLLAATSLDGSYAPVTNGSAVMSLANRLDPFTTGSNGEFGWDTVPGFYEVEATKAGCGSATTPAFEVPPPKVDLQLILHCVSTLTVTTQSLPPATRGTSYSAQLVATGGVSPYKWKKTAALPTGLKLTKAGVLSGTPGSKLERRDYSIKVQATDSGGKSKQTALATLTLAVS